MVDLRTQRAYRELRPDPVPAELIDRVLKAATHAPSAENTQPWEFIVITDEATRQQIGALTEKMWDRGGREHAAHLEPALRDAVERWATGGLAEAPVHIVVCGDASKVTPELLPSSVYPAVQNLLLEAIDCGLGSLLSTLPVHAGPAFTTLLGLPAHIVPMALVPIGYPARPLGRPRRKPPSVHRDRW